MTDDAKRFAQLLAADLPLAERFEHMYALGLWGAHQSRSGLGSGLKSTARIRAWLPKVLRSLDVHRFLDIPCGDFFWMRRVRLGRIDYIGADIVAPLASRLQAEYGRKGRAFIVADLAAGPLPEADAVFCRDCLVHLSYANIARGMDVIRRSGARYLITTTFPEHDENTDIRDGEWRPLNLARPPFSFPAPVTSLNEGCTEDGGASADKTLAVWRVADL